MAKISGRKSSSPELDLTDTAKNRRLSDDV
jgi:hypothetical protein